MPKWLPSTRASRRIAARCLRASNAGEVELACQDRIACVDALSSPFIRVSLRKKLALVWRCYGQGIRTLTPKDQPHPEDTTLLWVLDQDIQ